MLPGCEKTIEHFHHILPRSSCHEKIHLGQLETELTGYKKKYCAVSALNQAIPYIYTELVKQFGEDHIHTCFGWQTAQFCKDSGMEKDHNIDALCIAGIGTGIKPESIGKDLPHCYEIKQYRRHDRQLIHSQRERTYKMDGETVCKNRHKRFEQKGDSLEEYAAKHPENVPKLSVTKSRRYYKDPDRILPGAVFIYLGKRYVLSGQSSGGKQYRAYGYGQKNFPAGQCHVIRHNEGLVYVD